MPLSTILQYDDRRLDADLAAITFGHLDLARITRPDATDWICVQAKAGRSCVVVTSNIHHLRLADRDMVFRDVVSRAELNVADGWPLVFAARAMGSSLPERVAGVDLVSDVLQAPERFRLAVIGGTSGAAERLAERVDKRHDVILVEPLPPGTWETSAARAALASRLAAAEAQLTLLGLGAPKQELLADQLRTAASGPIICCGAAIEMLAGVRPRAPRLVQAVGLEWAFRLALEPARLGPRYAFAAFSYVQIVRRELRRRRQ